MPEFYSQFMEFDPDKVSGDQLYAVCPLHNDHDASFTVNQETHEWYCHGCGAGGHYNTFISKYYDVSIQVGSHIVKMWEQRGKIIFPSTEYVEACQKRLQNREVAKAEILAFGISEKVIEERQLGWDDIRLTIPIKSRVDKIINVRKYLPPSRRIEGSNNAKVINIRGLGECRLYPYDIITDWPGDKEDPVYVVEGEKDCLVALSQGMRAVTGTGGSTIPLNELDMLKGLDVILMLDADQTGARTSKQYGTSLYNVVKSLHEVSLPVKDFSDYWAEYHTTDVSSYMTEYTRDSSAIADSGEKMSLVKSEYVENLNTWITLTNISVTGVDPKTYSVPCKLKAVCNNSKCPHPCHLMAQKTPTVVDVDYRQILQFVDANDAAQDTYLRKLFGCKSIIAEPDTYINVQKILFQESASFIEGLEESSFDHRYGIYLYEETRLMATLKYDFESCRVTDPRSQQNYYVIRKAITNQDDEAKCTPETLNYFKELSSKTSAQEMIEKHYALWLGTLGIEGRSDLFASILLTYLSVTELIWRGGTLKGWLDTMVIGDTRTGKSQMAQRFVKTLRAGTYINGENARRTGIIGGVQRFGDSWIITWGAIPMNDRGLLAIDEASGLEIDDIKELSATRSSGAVTINKIAKGEARARTRLLWFSNPRSGRNIEDFYWKGYGAFIEFIPVAEDQARYDLLLTAAREDVPQLSDINFGTLPLPDVSRYRQLIKYAWNIPKENIIIPAVTVKTIQKAVLKLDEDYGGGPLIVGVAAHEKVIRLAVAFAILSGSIDLDLNTVNVTVQHVEFADEFLRTCFDKVSLDYAGYIHEARKAQRSRDENVVHIKGILSLYPALSALMASSIFRSTHIQDSLGLDREKASVIISELLQRGLLRITGSGAYAPDKTLISITRQLNEGR